MIKYLLSAIAGAGGYVLLGFLAATLAGGFEKIEPLLYLHLGMGALLGIFINFTAETAKTALAGARIGSIAGRVVCGAAYGILFIVFETGLSPAAIVVGLIVGSVIGYAVALSICLLEHL